MSKKRSKAVIAAIFRLLPTTGLFVQFIDFALYDHGCYHRKEKTQQHQQYGLVPFGDS
jgi:hypothetical protein